FRDLEAAGAVPAPVVAIGNFDGVHLGHRKIIETVTERARALSGTSILMTFDPHPLSILRPAGRPPLILPMSEKIRILSTLGLDVLLIIRFTREFADLSAERFVEEILARKLAAKEVHVGANFHFGRGGVGDFELLKKEGARHGIKVSRVPEVFFDSRPVSSTRIRDNILKGAVDRAAAMLGTEYFIRGLVVHGRGRGAGLGFSTANLSTDNELIPSQGVYVTKGDVAGRIYPSVTNIGDRPTFGERERVVEAHLLDYVGPDLYGRTMRLSFCRMLREERKFESPSALTLQIKKDVAAARAWFKEQPAP
ncbi:MAG TPA: bifunctional riboflavin kinase/FAD synthetase, partial [Candidatus Polarisedimenticolia bacterium]|nr:bifunctional riboflavin kinase/FAD synthetase [Candidatus Polarisedimenticolia bacterium]